MSDYPTGLTATHMNGGCMLDWDSASPNAMYLVYMKHSLEGGRIPIGVTTSTHYCMADIVPGGLYFWQVQMMGDERASSTISFIYPVAKNTAPKKPAKKVAMKSNV